MLLEVSIMEGIYIIYMFVFFKTCYTVEFNKLGSNMITELLSKELNIDSGILFDHPIERSDIAESQICMFGKYASIVIFIYLIVRNYLKRLNKINSYVIIIIFIFCFMNYNALIYMLPIFMLELYMTNIGLVGKNITNN